MPEERSPDAGLRPDIEAKLHELARALRDARYLGPETQKELADLVDELTDALDPARGGRPETTSRVAETATHLAQALRRPHDTGLLAAARDRLEEAAVRAAAEAPLATGILRRLVDVLSNIGI